MATDATTEVQKADALIAAFAGRNMDWHAPNEWLYKAARRFVGISRSDADPRQAATAILAYFAATDFDPTTDPHEIVHTTFNAFS